MDEKFCPICGRMYEDERNKRSRFSTEQQCVKQDSKDEQYLNYFCSYYGFGFALHRNIVDRDSDVELREEILNLVTEYMLHFKANHNLRTTQRRCFYYNDTCDEALDGESRYVNIAKFIQTYPRKTIDVANRSLVNFSLKYPRYGDIISPSWLEKRISFEHNYNNTHSSGVFLLLEDLGYVKDPDARGEYIITAEGWQRIEQLQKEEQTIRQGFIAMSFQEETKSIREAFRAAIQQAGYAQALGKQVIICCREEEFNDKDKRPHFDISQKSMIVWKDEEELINRLKRRIEATVDSL